MNGDPYRSPSAQKGLSHDACSILCRNETASRPTTNKKDGEINSIPSSRNLRADAPISLIGVVVAIILGLSLTNTRLGVYILLDYFGDDESDLIADPSLGPIQLSDYATAVPAYELPSEIEQPSGISYLEEEDAFAVVTDQAELFIVSDDFRNIESKTELAGGLLVMRQGSVEATCIIDDKRIAIIGETGRIGVWRKEAGLTFAADAQIEVSGYSGETEFSGIAFNPQLMEYYLASDETLTISILDHNGRLVREIALEDSLRGQEKPGRTLTEYQISGLAYSDGRLFAVSETYNTIFVIDPAQGVVRTLGIEGGGQISGIAVHENIAYLPIDHNYVDERPPLFLVELNESS